MLTVVRGLKVTVRWGLGAKGRDVDEGLDVGRREEDSVAAELMMEGEIGSEASMELWKRA